MVCKRNILLSLLIVAFGQPAWSFLACLFASTFGYALFFHEILKVESIKKRFWIGTFWYAAVQCIDLSWALSHPFFYAYLVLPLVSFLFGLQWGLFCILLSKKAVSRALNLFALSGVWVLFEWSRLFVFSGLPFNPAGLALTGTLLSLQTASLVGIYGLSFIVILTNLFGLKAILERSNRARIAFLLLACFPYVFGVFHLYFHLEKMADAKTLSVVLVQPNHPVEEEQAYQSAKERRENVLKQWKEIFTLLKPYSKKKIDLIVLPEYIVPYGTFHSIYWMEEVEELFKSVFEEKRVAGSQEKRWRVSNAYIASLLAEAFQSDLIVGLEDSVYLDEKRKQAAVYSAAFYFGPDRKPPKRYEKRVLVPMGEYIPFSFLKTIAASYGIQGSFTPGSEAQVFDGKIKLSPSICYEEIFGHLTRECRLKGAEILVNLTNDGWFPHSMLARQHFDHAKLRTVENGIPLIRATNTGITAGIDSLGKEIAVLKPDLPGALGLDLPLYHYRTLYSLFGDWFILFLSVVSIGAVFIRECFLSKKEKLQ